MRDFLLSPMNLFGTAIGVGMAVTSIRFPLEAVRKGPIDNQSVLVQVLPEPMPTQFTDAYMRH